MNLMSLDGARSAGKSVCINSHDTQSGGLKQSLKQNVQNTKVSDGSSNAHSDGTIMSGGFRQCKTGKKVY